MVDSVLRVAAEVNGVTHIDRMELDASDLAV